MGATAQEPSSLVASAPNELGMLVLIGSRVDLQSPLCIFNCGILHIQGAEEDVLATERRTESMFLYAIISIIC